MGQLFGAQWEGMEVVGGGMGIAECGLHDQCCLDTRLWAFQQLGLMAHVDMCPVERTVTSAS